MLKLEKRYSVALESIGVNLVFVDGVGKEIPAVTFICSPTRITPKVMRLIIEDRKYEAGDMRYCNILPHMICAFNLTEREFEVFKEFFHMERK